MNSFWELLRAKKDDVSRQVLDKVLAKCQSLVSTAGASTFYGAVPESTVTTALLSVLQDSLPQQDELLALVNYHPLVQELTRAVGSRLLQIMQPHAFLQQAYAGFRLPPDYEHYYFHKQEHYNLKQLLIGILSSDPLPSLAVNAPSSHLQCQSETAMEEPETSAAAEAKAAAACGSHLLQRSSPQSKWVIFTSTTSDMDCVLPTGNIAMACLNAK